jgi:hypothetical protein
MTMKATNWALYEAPVGDDTEARLALVALADSVDDDGQPTGICTLNQVIEATHTSMDSSRKALYRLLDMRIAHETGHGIGIDMHATAGNADEAARSEAIDRLTALLHDTTAALVDIRERLGAR